MGTEEEEFILDDTIIEEKEEEKGFLKKLYNKTVIPDMIDNKMTEKRRKREYNKELKKIQAEAKKEAIQELKPDLKELYKKQELERLRQTPTSKIDKLKKFGSAFSLQGTGIGSTDKINEMLGVNNEEPKKKKKKPQSRIPDPSRWL